MPIRYSSGSLSSRQPALSRGFAFQAEQDGVDVACVSRRPTPGLERNRPSDLLSNRSRQGAERPRTGARALPFKPCVRAGPLLRCSRAIVRRSAPDPDGRWSFQAARWIEIPDSEGLLRRVAKARRVGPPPAQELPRRTQGSGSSARGCRDRWAAHPQRWPASAKTGLSCPAAVLEITSRTPSGSPRSGST